MSRPVLHPDASERDASAWQRTRHHYPEVAVEHAAADLAVSAWLGRFTGHVSPAALAVAWLDWSAHLLMSPDEQAELATHAPSAAWRRLAYSGGAATEGLAGPVKPLAQDKRFVDPA